MSVRPRKDRNLWIIDVKYRFPDGHIERIRESCRTKRGALRREREIMNALEEGTWIGKEGEEEKKRLTLKQFSKEFIETYARVNNKYSEVISKRGILKNHLLPALGRKRLCDVKTRDIEAYKARKLRQGLRAKSINNHLAILSKMFSTAVDWEILEQAPRCKLLRIEKPRFDFLDFDEANRLLDAATGQPKAIFTTILRTGLRLGEVRALGWDDVDLIAKRMMVWKNVVHNVEGTPKSGREREIPLCDSVVEVLKQQRHLRGNLVFCDDSGKRLSLKALYNALNFTCRKAGLRRVGFHVLRHYADSRIMLTLSPVRQLVSGFADFGLGIKRWDISGLLRLQVFQRNAFIVA